jgi:hypothetical protein
MSTLHSRVVFFGMDRPLHDISNSCFGFPSPSHATPNTTHKTTNARHKTMTIIESSSSHITPIYHTYLTPIVFNITKQSMPQTSKYWKDQLQSDKKFLAQEPEVFQDTLRGQKRNVVCIHPGTWFLCAGCGLLTPSLSVGYTHQNAKEGCKKYQNRLAKLQKKRRTGADDDDDDDDDNNNNNAPPASKKTKKATTTLASSTRSSTRGAGKTSKKQQQSEAAKMTKSNSTNRDAKKGKKVAATVAHKNRAGRVRKATRFYHDE